MRTLAVGFVSVLFAAIGHAQEIQEVPASKSGVVLPEDIFALPPDQWFVARQVSQGSEPCLPQACEAGFNSGRLVISVEHANGHVRVIAGFRDCANVAFQEVETGLRPGKYTRSKVRDAIKDVVKGAEKSCQAKAPDVPQLDIASLFPRDSN
jgi:hypothetical protein